MSWSEANDAPATVAAPTHRLTLLAWTIFAATIIGVAASISADPSELSGLAR